MIWLWMFASLQTFLEQQIYVKRLKETERKKVRHWTKETNGKQKQNSIPET
jgi:hypothetical protein